MNKKNAAYVKTKSRTGSFVVIKIMNHLTLYDIKLFYGDYTDLDFFALAASGGKSDIMVSSSCQRSFTF